MRSMFPPLVGLKSFPIWKTYLDLYIRVCLIEATNDKVVSRIYQQGIDSKQCASETKVPAWETFDKEHLVYPWLVVINEKNEVCVESDEFTTILWMSSKE